MEWSRIIQPQESLALYKSLNPLCLDLSGPEAKSKVPDWGCAADFALLNLPKGKSLGRSKSETNSSNEQAH
jgi:hypothetical protein